MLAENSAASATRMTQTQHVEMPPKESAPSPRRPSPPPPSPSSKVTQTVSAFYSLVFPTTGYIFYVQTLSVTIGRRCAAAPSTGQNAAQIDVDLGALKSVSRLHAKIEYDSDLDRFVLAVLGRNGAWVDGVWSGSGSRAILGERSRIQIATRTFEFVLPPPPPAPDDTPSPSSLDSGGGRRRRSPSLDITSISPPSSQPHSPPLLDDFKPLPPATPPPAPQAQLAPADFQLPNTNSITRKTNKKRRRSDAAEEPPSATFDTPIIEDTLRPSTVPSKPTYTYTQLIYRAIKALNNNATLQEICAWIQNEFEYYRFTDSSAWTSSVRHNLSSSKAFKKGDRCGGDRGKGFFWSLDTDHHRIIEEQEVKQQQQTAKQAQAANKKAKKDKSSESSKRTKGDTPLFSTTPRPLPPPKPTTGPSDSATPTPTPSVSTARAGLFTYQPSPLASTSVTAGYSGTPITSPSNFSTAPSWRIPPAKATSTSTVTPLAPVLTSPARAPPPSSTPSLPPTPAPSVSTPAPFVPPPAAGDLPAPVQVAPTPASDAGGIPDIPIPIVLGVIPEGHAEYTPGKANNAPREGYMVLHERKLILDPDVFSDLTPEILEKMEAMGARKVLEVLTAHMIRVLKERRKARKKATKSGSKKRKELGDVAGPSAPAAATPTIVEGDDMVIDIVGSDDEPTAKKRKLEL
ncbi:hypothetical protein CYLTODRAFT_416799 [Cylindrobasidium torrendii FP15055 ss-10]|uniref:Fork-head domain-containing protein n=1 Tax=Cylindrobasidium torrendii FP15055 ss-10 TaxID=1314674 RepID=A0A0D7BU69_9AGAR|nr:hypothetical protein CYLTODRAFT_416799 [Cylindrobasidium torrendii FP15055 ss-10]